MATDDEDRIDFADVSRAYEAMWRAHAADFSVHMDFAKIDELLVAAILAEGFNVKQAGCIHAYAYTNNHSCYGDMIGACSDLCDFVKAFLKCPTR